LPRRVAAFLFFVFFLLMSREPPWGDARVTFETARALLDHGRLNIELDAPSYFFTVFAGKKFGFATLGNLLASVPSILLFRALRPLFAALSPQAQAGWAALSCHLSAAAMMAVTAGLFYSLCRRRGAQVRLAVGLSVGLGLSTICFCYARSPYSEALQTLSLLWLVERTLTQAQPQRMSLPGMASLGAAAGIVLNAKLVYAAVLPACALYVLYFLWRPRADAPSLPRPRLLAGLAVAFAAFLPFVGLVAWHNYVKTGSPFRTGYWGDLFSGQLGPALYGYLFSSGQSIFLYSPPLLLAVMGARQALFGGDASEPDRQARRESALILTVIAIVTLLNAKYFLWHGAFCWGPRLMVPLTPLLLLLCLPWLPGALARGQVRLRQAATLALFALGTVVQLLGASLYWDHFLRIAQTVRDAMGGPLWSPDYLPHVYFVPQFAPLRGYPWLLSHMLRGDANLAADAPWRTLYTQPIDLSTHFPRLRLDFWLLDWGRHPLCGGLLLGLFLLLAAASAVALLRGVRAEEAG
jgi:hypothetical protein